MAKTLIPCLLCRRASGQVNGLGEVLLWELECVAGPLSWLASRQNVVITRQGRGEAGGGLPCIGVVALGSAARLEEGLSQDLETGCPRLAIVNIFGIRFFK